MVLRCMHSPSIRLLTQQHTWGSHVGYGLSHGEPCEEAIMRMRTQFLYLMSGLQWNTRREH